LFKCFYDGQSRLLGMHRLYKPPEVPKKLDRRFGRAPAVLLGG